MEHPAFTLAALTTMGGAMGYARKGSKPSLLAGLVFGGVYGYAGYLLHKNADGGLEIALGASSLMLLTGIARGVPSRFKKPVPLVLTVLGGLGTFYYYRKYKEFYP
ncbi:LAQU0S04e09648g1_1 [Lachancea quebecensis]|uniref:LAQU0S04e09648g1_1 n=1 Tax=Lachancea quebecensis TaxID=1654605 RepID=A0A0P1KQI8_9SACH|nr:LAQU0S04e09648g1_1 [Lachancea quebecensis]